MIKKKINNLAYKIGNNPLLVQGAGGNISWKENNRIFVKASGTWLAHAHQNDIFICLDLLKVRDSIIEGNDNFKSSILSNPSNLRPSIETALHALLPQKVVLHIHPVDLIALTVMPNAIEALSERLIGIDWEWVGYKKPGKELANAVKETISKCEITPSILVLLNHGLVISADTVEEVEWILSDLIDRLKLPELDSTLLVRPKKEVIHNWNNIGYLYVESNIVQLLSFNEKLLKICNSAWVLYPDHVVFLGPRCFICESIEDVPKEKKCIVVIIPKLGVFIDNTAPKAAISMLECYAEIISRIPNGEPIPLKSKAITELLTWEAEEYRKNLQIK